VTSVVREQEDISSSDSGMISLELEGLHNVIAY
jgi:hypothetical protein